MRLEAVKVEPLAETRSWFGKQIRLNISEGSFSCQVMMLKAEVNNVRDSSPHWPTRIFN